jgi:hypothetical protein
MYVTATFYAQKEGIRGDSGRVILDLHDRDFALGSCGRPQVPAQGK